MSLEDPEELLEDLPPWQRHKANRFRKELRKERETLRSEAVETIKQAKEEDWSKKEVLRKLSPEQINLVGELLPEMLEAHLSEEVELILLDAAADLTRGEEKRQRKLRKQLQEHRREEMLHAAEKIERMEAEGADKEQVLSELTRAERWALGDLVPVLVQSLPDAVRDLETYLDDHDDLREGERELLEDHLEHLRETKIEHARKGLKHVDKLTRKGKPPKAIAEDLSILERVCLGDALRSLLQPALSERIAGLESFVGEARLFEEEVEMWEDHLDELRERRRELNGEAIEKIKDLKADAEPPEAIADELSTAEADAVGKPLERMLQATLPEDVDVLAALTSEDGKVDKARKAARKARADALEAALAKVVRLRDGEDKLIGGTEPKSPREVVEALDWTERQLLEEVLEVLLDPDPLARLDALETFVDEAARSEPVAEVWDAHLQTLRETRDDVREEAIDTIRDLKEEGAEPETVVEALSEREQAFLGDQLLSSLAEAGLPEEVDVAVLKAGEQVDKEALREALDEVREARREARAEALEALHEAQDDGQDLQEAISELPYGQRRVLEEDPPEVEDGRLVEEPPDTGGLFSFGRKAPKEPDEETSDPDETIEADADTGSSGGGLMSKLPIGSASAKDKSWKAAFAKRLLGQGVPKAEVVALVRKADAKGVGDLPEGKRERILDALERKALDEGS